ncbi:hypothetical protein GV819_13680 [Pseudomonas sp. Fl5BN2]|uniref:hypothetical protein n=1 Tax=unclassified Pseudomonas TaxID=196821 RepID=UPI0013786AF6|nr:MULTISPECIES: hypothetical protein [unclassified Pseudomonas]NBF03344.1 hypothetical protein [Pseudomonas sp. Fl5BN2]NBF09266.1 hypothetical protein [Pseudomonas sp. Fl4BN1]
MNRLLHFTLLFLGLASLPALAQAAQDIDLNCHPPSAAPDASAGQEAFDRYSWQMFVALNWPAQTGQRGQPDCSAALGSRGQTVWQTYKGVHEIFLPEGRSPGPWNSPLLAKKLSLINIAGRKNMATANSDNQAVGGWLIDQNGKPTYYEIAANELSYNYIVANQFYNADVVAKAGNITFPNATSEIKSSWRVLTQQDDSSRYLQMPAKITTYNDKGVANGTEQATLGLVGLHIVNKAEGYPQWIWSTFEQVDNVPPKVQSGNQWVNQPVPGVKYSYFNVSAPANTLNQSPCDWTLQNGQMTCVPKAGMSFTTPNPLDRFTPLTKATTKLNSQFQSAPQVQASVFKYYQLITTQWSSPPNPGSPSGQLTPELSANVTMESYIQPSSSCTNCHSMATPINNPHKSDFSYLFKFAKSPSSLSIQNKE